MSSLINYNNKSIVKKSFVETVIGFHFTGLIISIIYVSLFHIH